MRRTRAKSRLSNAEGSREFKSPSLSANESLRTDVQLIEMMTAESCEFHADGAARERARPPTRRGIQARRSGISLTRAAWTLTTLCARGASAGAGTVQARHGGVPRGQVAKKAAAADSDIEIVRS